MSARIRRLPPGRVGLTWLAHRSAMAERAGELLDHKLRILLAEEQNYALAAERTELQWRESVQQLQTWMLRSAVISGDGAAGLAGPGLDCSVSVEWRLEMGVRYPASARCHPDEVPTAQRSYPDSALVEAVPAAARAVRAGVDHAVAARALLAIRREIASTRRQLRALRQRWLPALGAAQRDLMTTLADQEQEDHVRLRWAAAGAGRAER